MEAEMIQLNDTVKDMQFQAEEKRRQCDEAMKENIRLRESNKKLNDNVEELTQQLSDSEYHLNLK